MSEKETLRYSHRFLARVVLETATPLAVGSGEESVLSDALVATDVNGLPNIPGSAVAGVMRHMAEREADRSDNPQLKEIVKKIFGYHDENGGEGSEIIFSEAKILDHEGKPMDGLDWKAISTDPLLVHYRELPVRQHVRITGKGVAEKGGKFDSQVVFSGTRFCFEIEMVSDGTNEDAFNMILKQLLNKDFRIGGGTRKGYGAIRIVDLKTLSLNLKEETDLVRYISKRSSLLSNFWDDVASVSIEAQPDPETIIYRLSLTPDSFFIFGSGFGDSEADMTPVKAERVDWQSGKGVMKENLILIPASSVKGALSHRTAFHWNRLNNLFADLLAEDKGKLPVGSGNIAVRLLFGSDGLGDERNITRGNVILSDVILSRRYEEKLLNHLAVDRFSGGAWAGALFAEKVIEGEGCPFDLTITLRRDDLRKAYRKVKDEVNQIGEEEDTFLHRAIKAFECALNDVCKGRLPLGGGVNRGHGIFTGKLEIKDYERK